MARESLYAGNLARYGLVSGLFSRRLPNRHKRQSGREQGPMKNKAVDELRERNAELLSALRGLPLVLELARLKQWLRDVGYSDDEIAKNLAAYRHYTLETIAALGGKEGG